MTFTNYRIRGTIVHAPHREIKILPNAMIEIDSTGVIRRVVDCESSDEGNDVDLELAPGEFIMPGFIDLHYHAAQYAYAGTATGVPLMQWIGQHAVPTELAASTDLEWAKALYSAAVTHGLRLGTTSTLYFGTAGVDSCKVLSQVAEEYGQRAFVGVVSMDNGPGARTTEECAQDCEMFCAWAASQGNLTTPVVTPRFAPSCTEGLLSRLSQIASHGSYLVQSHVAESLDAIEATKEFHKTTDVELFQRTGLLTPRTVLAHGVHLTPNELKILSQAQTTVVHCPLSHAFFAHGMTDVVQWKSKYSFDKVGLGTDVAGGYSPSMCNSMRTALLFSAASARSKTPFSPELTLGDVLYMATQAGANALGLGDRLGTIEPGKYFDAILVRSAPPIRKKTERIRLKGGGNTDGVSVWPYAVMPTDTISDRLEKFITLGDDRNVAQVWVNGRALFSQ